MKGSKIMKNFKILMAVMISMLAFGLTSYAATFNFDEDVVVENDTATVTLKLDPNATISSVGETCAMSFEIGDGLEFEIADGETITEPNGKGYWNALGGNLFLWTYEETIEFASPSEYAFEMTFTVKESGDKTVTLKINDDTYYCDGEGDEIEGIEEVSITIPDPAPADPEPGDVGEKDGYVTVVDDSKATRFVVSETKTSVSATAATVLKATYDGTTQQANLANLLGVTIEEDADITINSLTIKMVLPATVTESSAIGAYSFEIE